MLCFSLLPTAARHDAGIGHLGRCHDVARLHMARVNRAGKLQHIHTLVDAHLLFAHHQQVAVRQHLHHRGGDGAGEGLIVGRVARAFERVVAFCAHTQLAHRGV